MGLTAKTYKKVLNIIEVMHDHVDLHTMRRSIAKPLLNLLNADYFASFYWDSISKKYGNGVYLNMDDSNIENYYSYYQFNDPITSRLAQRQLATSVSQIMPHNALKKTEFFNDFLLTDGLFYGINLHLHHHGENIGDFRIWRKRGKCDFENEECQILDLLKPHVIQSVRNIKKLSSYDTYSADKQCLLISQKYFLTIREGEVVRLLLDGESDERISYLMNISITTVRTHIKHIFHKVGINSRTKLQSIAIATPCS